MAWGPLSGSSSQVITSAAAFTPSDIGGLLQFLESDRGVTAPTDDKVTIWADEQSGDDRDVTQTSDASRPIETASIFDTNPGFFLTVSTTGWTEHMIRALTLIIPIRSMLL